MDTKLPRIAKIKAGEGRTVLVTWKGGEAAETVDLAGWIATGGPVLAPLAESETFRRAAVGEHGAGVTWDDDEGDLAIDAVHLALIAAEQRPFGGAEAAACQDRLGLSNVESAALLGVSPSTWATYKNGSVSVPTAVAIACRSAMRDPVVLQAHLRPARAAGRPKRQTV